MSGLLDGSLDLDTTLANVAQASVPEIADWCAVHMVDPDGRIELMAVAHQDADKERLARELDERYPTPRRPTPACPRPSAAA